MPDTGITEFDVLRAAQTLERVARLYRLSRTPDEVELSAAWLRRELPHILADQKDLDAQNTRSE